MNHRQPFDIILHSGMCAESNKLYPENKASDFTTHLTQPLSFIGPWEVALRDIQFRNPYARIRSIYTIGFIFVYKPVPPEQTEYYADEHDVSMAQAMTEYAAKKYNKEDFRIRFASQLLDLHVHRSLTQIFRWLYLSMSKCTEDQIRAMWSLNTNGRVNIERIPNHEYYVVADHPEIFETMGFEFGESGIQSYEMEPQKRKIYILPQSAIASKKPRPEWPDDLMIKTNFIAPIQIGDTKKKVLAFVPTSDCEDKLEVHEPADPSYLQVNSSELNDITLKIRTIKGEEPQISGYVRARLSFRPQQHF